MAIEITALGSAAVQHSGASVETAALTPTGGFVLLGLHIAEGSPLEDINVTGLGLTWSRVATISDGGIGWRRVYVYIGVGTPTPGAITLSDDGGAVLTGDQTYWSASQVDGGTGNVAQVGTAYGQATVALPEAPDPESGAYVLFGTASVSRSLEAGWSQLASVNISGEAALIDGWRPDAATSATGTFGGSIYGSILLELEAAGDDPPPDPTTVSIDQSDPQQVEVGSTLQLSATVTNGDGATTWDSDDEAVATVDASGLVSGVAVGSAEITATNNGVSDSITVNVEAAPAQAPTVTITSPAGNIAVTEGTTIVATATATDPVDGDLSAEIEWTSSVDGALGTGASIQIVTEGWSAGNRTITATATNAAELEDSASFVLTIGEAPEPPEPEPSFDAARFAINAAGGIA